METISTVCDKTVYSQLNHTPLFEKLNVGEFLSKRALLLMNGLWCTFDTSGYYAAVTLTEDGICMTFNPISAGLFFRNETVDPKFLAEYHLATWSIEPRFWTMDEGYDSSRIEFDNYPLRVFDKNKDNGYTIYISAAEGVIQNVDPVCRRNPMNIKIALHHPAEVITKKFYLIPFNKSVTFLVKPQIKKTSEGLRLYDPSV